MSPLPGKTLRPTLLASTCALLVLVAGLLQSCLKRETLAARGAREQVLHRGIGHELEDLDPHFAAVASDYHVLSALFEGLVAEDPVDLHPVPGVAERWDCSDDGRVFTFHLRRDARWSDGSPLGSADFAASFRRVLSPALGAKGAPALYVLRGAEAYHRGETRDFSTVGVEAPDAHTLRLTLREPRASFLAMLAQPVWFPVHLPSIARLGPVEQRGNAWARPETMVCNGPFTLAEWSVNHRIVVRKSANYWDAARVRLREIHFYPLSVDTEERAFRAGQLHLTDALPAGKGPVYQRLHPGRLRTDPLLGTYFFRLNTRLPALADARVRRALSLSVDRPAIIASILQGGQKPATSFTPTGIAGYVPPQTEGRNLVEARRLLAEAGHPGGAGLPALEILFNSSDTHRAVAEALQEMWRKELGLRVKLVNMEQTSVLNARRTGDYQILRSSWTADYADPENFLGIWTSASGDNFTGWSSPAYDALIAEAARTIDGNRRKELYAAAESILMEASPFIGIYHYTHLFLIHPSVRGWHPTALDHHPYKHVWLEP